MRLVDYTRVRRQLQSAQAGPLYVLHSGDGYLQAELVGLLRSSIVAPGMEEFGYQLVDGTATSIGEILDRCRTPGFFGPRLLVVEDHPVFGGEDEGGAEALAGYAGDPAPETCLVFRLQRPPDRRRKLTRALSGFLVDCSPLPGGQLAGWLREFLSARGAAAEPAAVQALVSMLGDSMPVLASEAEKAMAYAGRGNTITRQHVDAVVVGLPQETIFALLDAVVSGRAAAALAALAQLRARGEAAPVILVMLARQLRLIRLARELAAAGLAPPEMARQLGQHPYTMKNCAAQARRFNRRQLVKGLELVLQADHRVKSGRMDEDLALQRLVADLVQLSSLA